MAAVIPVKVVMRARPLINKEINEGCECILDFDDNQVIVNQDKSFTYDHIFPENVVQSYVYDTAVMPLVDAVMDGYNATVLAYGQTGSGKTYTMGSAYTKNICGDDVGVIPRAIDDIFDRISKKTTHVFCVKLSYLEIYKEEIKDLFRGLNGSSGEKVPINIRDAPDGSTVISGLAEIPVVSSEQTLELMDQGNSMRSTAATAMNATSSRSHAVFSILLECKNTEDNSDLVTSRFHLVDLAGSERASRTKAQGTRFDEGVQINKGLLCLGNVISALSSGNSHVNYRDSKLTRLLQDSLGGNSRTVMIACVSPSDSNMMETINTLRYASRVRKIKNKPIVNRDPHAAEVINLKKEIQRLRLQILEGGHSISSPDTQNKLGTTATTSSSSSSQNSKMLSNYIKENKDLKNSNKDLSDKLHNQVNNNADLCEKLIKSDLEKELIEATLNKVKNVVKNMDITPSEDEILTLKELVNDDNMDFAQAMEKTLHVTANDDDDMEVDSEKSIETDEANCKIESGHNLKTAQLSKDLIELSKALALKEELAKKMVTGDDELKKIRAEYEEKISQLDEQILSTLKEKEELNNALQLARKNKENISEKRRKRLQELEAQIQELKREKKEKERIFQLKQKSDQRVSKLNSEIQAMKSCRVKLLQQIKHENEKFRSMKKEKEKEVKQLQEKNRKRQFEITKLERNFDKQQAVLRRKTEEAAAAKKRLHAALAKQRSASEKRENTFQNSAVGPKVRAWLDDEIEIGICVASVKHHLTILLEDRKTLKQDLQECQDSRLPKGEKRRRTLTVDPANTEKRNKLKEELDLKNSQIADMQKKLSDFEDQQRKNNRWTNISSMSEARCAMKYLMDLTIKSHLNDEKINSEKQENLKESQLMKEEIENLKNEVQQQIEKLNEVKMAHEKELIETEDAHQHKVLYIMKQMNQRSTSESISDENLRKKLEFQSKELEAASKYKDELENYKLENKNLKQKLSSSTTPVLNGTKSFFGPLPVAKVTKKIKPSSAVEYVENITDSESEEEELGEDYIPTPLRRRTRKFADGCGCLSIVCGASKRCKCVKLGKLCSEHCKCSPANCKNHSGHKVQDENDEGDESVNKTLTKSKVRHSTYKPTFFNSPLKEIINNNESVFQSPTEDIKPRLLPDLLEKSS